MSSAIVLIDFWDFTRITYLPFSRNWKRLKKIKQFIIDEKIETIILSSYDCFQEYDCNTIWYNNSKRFLGNRNFQKKTKLAVSDRKTNPIVLNWIFENQTQIAMHYDWEFLEYFQNKKLEKIYIAGQAWELCVSNRPLGYKELYRMTKDWNTEILVKDDFVKDLNGNMVKLSKNHNPEWIATVTKDVFRYAPVAKLAAAIV